MPTTEQSNLPPNIFEWKLDKNGLIKAVEFWFNNEILNGTCEVLDISELSNHPQAGTFNIRFIEEKDEAD